MSAPSSEEIAPKAEVPLGRGRCMLDRLEAMRLGPYHVNRRMLYATEKNDLEIRGELRWLSKQDDLPKYAMRRIRACLRILEGR